MKKDTTSETQPQTQPQLQKHSVIGETAKVSLIALGFLFLIMLLSYLYWFV